MIKRVYWDEMLERIVCVLEFTFRKDGILTITLSGDMEVFP